MNVELRAMAAQLVKLEKDSVRQHELLTAIILELVELNKLMKKLNYISGTSASVTKDEVEEELAFLKQHVEDYSDTASKIVKIAQLENLKKEDNSTP